MKVTKIPANVDPSKLAKLLDSVAIKELPAQTDAGMAARAAADPESGDSYLRGTEISQNLFKQLQQANHETGETVTLKTADGKLTAAGTLLQAISEARADRDVWFDPPKSGAVLTADFRNVDLNRLGWKDSKSEYITVTGIPSSELTVYWADQGPADPRPYVAPSRELGVLFYERGKDVDLARSGNMSASDPCASIKTELEQDGTKAAGVPEKLKLKNVNRDPSTVRREISADFFRDTLKVPVQRIAPAKWFANGEYQGFRDAEEPLDLEMWKAAWKDIDEEHEVPDKVWLFKAQWQLGVKSLEGKTLTKADLAYRGDRGNAYRATGDEQVYDLKTGKKSEASEAYGELASFIKTLNGIGLGAKDSSGRTIADNDPKRFNTREYREAMERGSDPYGMLRTLAGLQLTGAWDNLPNPSNYALACERDGDKSRWYMVPIDVDSTWGMCWSGQPKPQDMDLLMRGGQFDDAAAIWKNLLANDDFKAYYLDYLEHLLDKDFKPEKIQANVLKRWEEHQNAVYQEGSFNQPTTTQRPFTNDEISGHLYANWEINKDGLYAPPIKTFVEWRSSNARWQLDHIRHDFGKHSGVDFGAGQLTPR